MEKQGRTIDSIVLEIYDLVKLLKDEVLVRENTIAELKKQTPAPHTEELED